MDPAQSETPVGKADESSTSQVLNSPLYHILTHLLNLDLDTQHARVQNILYTNGFTKWALFEDLTKEDFKEMQYQVESTGKIIKFTGFDHKRFKMLNQFIQ